MYDKKRTTVVKESQTKKIKKLQLLRLSNVDQHLYIHIYICKHLITHQHFLLSYK